MLKKLIHFFIFFLFISTYGQKQQQLVFDVIHRDKKVGEFIARKVTNGETTEYISKTEINTRILTRIEVKYNFKVLYKNHELQNAYTEVLVNGKRRTNSKTQKHQNNYYFYDCGKKEQSITSPISFSSILLIFQEPKSIAKVYSEEHGEFHELKQKSAHCYLKTNPKGRINTYSYKNGHLQIAKLDGGLIDFELHFNHY